VWQFMVTNERPLLHTVVTKLKGEDMSKTWKELKAEGVRRCCAMYVSGAQCRRRASEAFEAAWCDKHGPIIEKHTRSERCQLMRLATFVAIFLAMTAAMAFGYEVGLHTPRPIRSAYDCVVLNGTIKDEGLGWFSCRFIIR
jgi:hypothetical protein